VLDRAGVAAIPVDDGGGCCGALSQHLSEHDEAKALARRNIDAWWPHLERGAEAIVVTASGCGVMVREYDQLLAHDGAYAGKAKRVAALARDPVELVTAEWPALAPLVDRERTSLRVAFQAPCTLQHGLRIRGQVERVLADAGFALAPVDDVHLCCGSAGTYSILQPEISARLKADKLHNLQANRPQVIASANIGCITHLQSGTPVPVRHWIELLDEALANEAQAPMPRRAVRAAAPVA